MVRKLDIMVMSGVEDGLVMSCTAEDDTNAWSISIGRREDNQVCLRNDTFISRLHAYLHWREKSWWLEDCNSKNGTFIEHTPDEEARVTGEIPVEMGQLFRVGRTWLRIQSSE